MNLNKFITKLLNEVSYRTKEGYPIFSNKEHIEILSEVLSEWGLDSIQSELIQNLLTEKGEVSTSAAKKAKDMGLDHIAFGFYSKNGEKPATHKADGENIVTVSKDEFEKVAAEKSGETPASDTKDDTDGKGDEVGDETEPQTGTALSPDTEGGKSYLKSLPDNDPAKPDDMKDDSEKTMSAGGVVYPVGGGYYADTPNGKPKYRKATEESINLNHFNYILEREITEDNTVVKQIGDGDGDSTGKTDSFVVIDDNISDIINVNDGDGATVVKAKEKIQAAIAAFDSQLEKILKNPKNIYSDDHKKVKTLMNKIFSGEQLDNTEKVFLKKYVRIAEPTEKNPNTAKYYIAKEPNNFKGTKRIKIEVGGKGQGNPNYARFRDFTEQSGLVRMSTSTFGTKLTTPNQTFIDSDGKTKLIKGEGGNSLTSVEVDSEGNVTKVVIGDVVVNKLDENEPNISEVQKKVRQRSNRNMNEYAKSIKLGDLQFIDMDNGVTPNTPENRVIVIKSALNGMADRLTQLAQKEGVSEDRINNIINSLKQFSEKDPNENPSEWFVELNSIMSSIANDEGEPSLKEAWANYAEIYSAIVEMHDNGRGTENGAMALLPESTTLETVDIITVKSNGSGDRKVVTLGGRSIKKGKGGASALTSKTEKSVYKNDEDGSKKQSIIELSKSHDDIYRMKLEEPMEAHKKYQSDYRSTLIEKSTKLGVDQNFMDNLTESLKKGGSAWKSIEVVIIGLVDQRSKKGKAVDDDTMQKIRMRLESYYMYNQLSHEAYNINVDVQDFSNTSILSQKTDKGGAELVKNKDIKIDSSDGINILAYIKPEFNVGAWGDEGRSGNAGAGRFHNQPKR